MEEYKKNSLSLTGAVSLGTGVMIGAGIFALSGQVAELSGQWFPIAFLVGAIISGFSAYSYIKLSNAYASAGGIAMYFKKIYGKGALTATGALLMAFLMVINESLVARTFGSYTLQLFDIEGDSLWVPILGVVLLIVAFLINISGNKIIDKSSLVMAILKIGGISIFAIGGLWAAGFSFSQVVPSSSLSEYPVSNYLGALALSILAYKGFTTITNSGGEIANPKKNVGRAIIISLAICTLIYLLVAFAVSSNLSIEEIIQAKDYSLAEASKPAFGKYGLWFTVGIAIVATISGVIASVFCSFKNDGYVNGYGFDTPQSFRNVRRHTEAYDRLYRSLGNRIDRFIRFDQNCLFRCYPLSSHGYWNPLRDFEKPKKRDKGECIHNYYRHYTGPYCTWSIFMDKNIE
jgi:amino acid transporter